MKTLGFIVLAILALQCHAEKDQQLSERKKSKYKLFFKLQEASGIVELFTIWVIFKHFDLCSLKAESWSRPKWDQDFFIFQNCQNFFDIF